jgi:predicted Zn-ribbon and HTH transcriptional regulator
MTLEALAVMRAEEQLAAGAWRRADRGEHLVRVLPACEVCGEQYKPNRHGPQPKPADLCPACRKKGWRATRCASCGHLVKTWDIGKSDCKGCRSERLEGKELL